MRLAASIIIIALVAPAARAADADQAATRGLDALLKTQRDDGHWGEEFSVAITSIAGLAILAQHDKPLEEPRLARAWKWLDAQQKEGAWPKQSHTWVHGQGFATLFAAELYGKLVAAEKTPGFDRDAIRSTLIAAVKRLEAAQSDSGGWYYDPAKGTTNDEGSTTVCAVQALRAAKNFGIAVDGDVLARGFDYLKRMQNPDGGFRYQGTAGGSMVAGTSGALSTLVLMSKLDHAVLFRAVKYLEAGKVDALDGNPFPEYALFYAMMAMKVLDEEFGKHMESAAAFQPAIRASIARSQKQDGTWANRGWMAPHSSDYATAFSVLTLAVPRGKLSVFHRDAPKLPG